MRCCFLYCQRQFLALLFGINCTFTLSFPQFCLQLIDFGRVNVGSVTAKNFSVANDLNQSVMVKVEELDQELQQSKHLCQIIPQVPLCVIGGC